MDFFSFLIGRQAKNINYLSIHIYMVMCSSIAVYWDLVYKDKQQYTEDIQVSIRQGNPLNK